MFNEVKRRSRVLLNFVENSARNNTNTNNSRVRGGERFSSSDATIQSYSTVGYTTEEQNLILRTINTCALEELKRYQMSEGRIKKLIAHRDKNQSFETLDQVLLLPGIDVAVLDKFCRSITKGQFKSQGKSRSGLIFPRLDERTRLAIETCTGVWVCGNIVSWAKMDTSCNLLRWDCRHFDDVSAKGGLVTTVDSVARIASEVPTSSVYVLENVPIVPFSRVKSAEYYSHLQRQQIVATVVSILGTRKHSDNEVSDEQENARWIKNVYMLRSRTPARLFNLLVGSEIVSARGVVKKMMDGDYEGENGVKIPVEPFPDIRQHYKSRDVYQREQMNWALLLTASFLNLSVLRSVALEKTNLARGDDKKEPKQIV